MYNTMFAKLLRTIIFFVFFSNRKSRLPFYQRIFNNHLRGMGIPVVDDYRSTSFTQEKLKANDAMTSSKVKRSDSASVTSEASNCVSSSNDGTANSSTDDALQSTFAHEQTIQEEDEYISPMDIHEEEIRTNDGAEGKGDNSKEVVSDDSDEEGTDKVGKDVRKRIEAKIAVMQINNGVSTTHKPTTVFQYQVSLKQTCK